MQGRKVINENGDLPEIGDYWLVSFGVTRYWLARTPCGLVASLKNHEVIEHEDGTITASPSILVTGWDGTSWHGYLERGVWREV